MSDKITGLRKRHENGRFLPGKRVVLLTLVAVAVCSVISLFLFSEEFNLDRVRRWAKYLTVRNDESFGSYSFDSHSLNCYDNFNDGLIVASISGVSVFDAHGDEQLVIQQQMQLPSMHVCDDVAMVYDVGGNDLIALHRKKGELLRLEESYPILDADLSTKGRLCLSSSANGYKSVLSVYNDDQELVYRWLSSSTYFPLCALSGNGKNLAAVAIGQSDGQFESKICYFKTDSDQILNEFNLGNELIYDLKFVKPDLICTVGESTAQFVSLDGERIGKYRFKDSFLKDFDLGGDGFLTLATNMYRAGNRYSLTTLDYAGNEIASRFIGEEILDISSCGNYIAVLTPGKLTVYTKSLSVYSEEEDVADATSAVMREDGSAILIGAGRGELYLP